MTPDRKPPYSFLCAKVDARLCLFLRTAKGHGPFSETGTFETGTFEVVAYEGKGVKGKTDWIFTCDAPVQAACKPHIAQLTRDWQRMEQEGDIWRTDTADFMRQDLNARYMLPALMVLDFQKSLKLTLSRAQTVMAQPMERRLSGEALPQIYAALLNHMALKALLSMADTDMAGLRAHDFPSGKGAAVWDSIFHANLREGQRAAALSALEMAVGYEDNITRRELLIVLQAEFQKDDAVRESCAHLSEMRPLRPSELARRGMAEMRSADKKALAMTIADLKAHGTAQATRYANRLEAFGGT